MSRSKKRILANKKTKFIIIAIIAAIIALIPVKFYYKDGGSVQYKSLVYSVWDYWTLDGLRGTEVQIFGLTVIDNTYQTDEPWQQRHSTMDDILRKFGF